MMKKKRKQAYCTPECSLVQLGGTTQFMEASMPGQHNPAHHGVGPGSAKQSFLWEDAEEEQVPQWND